MVTIGAYIGILLLVLGAPIVFLIVTISDFWHRRSRRRDLLQHCRSDTDDEGEVREYVRESTAHMTDRTERLAARLFVLTLVGWVIAAILYVIYG